MSHRRIVPTILVTAVLSGGLVALAYAQLGSVLKGGAVALAVDHFGPQINRGINALTGNKNVSAEQATKVVPILSIGNGSYLGAVQVNGPQEELDKVRLRALIPIAARSVSNLHRVPGVGVSALVDIKL